VRTTERSRCDSQNIFWAFVFGYKIAQNCALSQLSLCTHNSDHSLCRQKLRKTENSKLHGFEVHRPSSKGTTLLLQIIKAIINHNYFSIYVQFFSPNGPSFFWSMIHQVIWPSLGTLIVGGYWDSLSEKVREAPTIWCKGAKGHTDRRSVSHFSEIWQPAFDWWWSDNIVGDCDPVTIEVAAWECVLWCGIQTESI